jgi:hypothetical protein
MYVTDDRNFSLVGTRGFAKPGDYNSRILLLVNGHRVNDNVFGQAEIGAEFGIDPRCSSGSRSSAGRPRRIYGDSAFFAVVNVITRSGAALDGASVALEGRHARHGADARQRRAAARATAPTSPSRAPSSRARRRTAVLPGVRYAGHQPRHRARARRRTAGAVLRPAAREELHLHRRLRRPAPRRADGLVRHAVQRSRIAEQTTDRHTLPMSTTPARSAATA